MWFLFTQIWLWILISFALGWLTHWFFFCRGNHKQDAPVNENMVSNEVAPAAPIETAETLTSEPEEVTQKTPLVYAEVPQQANDLKRIKGIGKVNEKALNGLGIYTFAQIAEWSDENVEWVEHSLAFPGRVTREDWIAQAKTLAAGETTDFAKKVDDGDVEYDS